MAPEPTAETVSISSQVVALAPGWQAWQEEGHPLEWHPQDRPKYDSVLLDGPALNRLLSAGLSSSRETTGSSGMTLLQ